MGRKEYLQKSFSFAPSFHFLLLLLVFCFGLVFSPLDSQHTMQAGLKSLGSSHLPECLPVESIELVSALSVFLLSCGTDHLLL